MFRIALCLLLLMTAAARAEEAQTGEAEGMSDCADAPVPADVERGAWFYEQACAHCHGPVDLIRPHIEGETEAEKAAWLDGLLQRHHCASNGVLRADLIAYLLGE